MSSRVNRGCEHSRRQMGNEPRRRRPTTFKITGPMPWATWTATTRPGRGARSKDLEAGHGIHIDHFVSIKFEASRPMVNAIGGVEECNTVTIGRTQVQLCTLSAGHHLLPRVSQRGLVRARDNLGNGSDRNGSGGRQQAIHVSRCRAGEEASASTTIRDSTWFRSTPTTKSDHRSTPLGRHQGLTRLATAVRRTCHASQVTFCNPADYPRHAGGGQPTRPTCYGDQPEGQQIFPGRPATTSR